MESLYLLLVTNRASNIVEDLETLRLLSKGTKRFICVLKLLSDLWFIQPLTVVPNVTNTSGNLGEEHIIDKCFDLIFAFDEVSSTQNDGLLFVVCDKLFVGHRVWWI